jgi:hypothetical protein
VSSQTATVAYSRFREALDSDDLDFIRRHAQSMPPILLGDALEVCLLIRRRDPKRYERAALRWLARFVIEAEKTTLAELKGVVGIFERLPDQPQVAMEELSALCVWHELRG